MKQISLILCIIILNTPVFAASKRPIDDSARSAFLQTTSIQAPNLQSYTTTETTEDKTETIDNEAEYLQKKAIYEQLQQQATEIAQNKQECEKAKKGWVAGTVIGSAGIVGTTIGAIVQGKKIKETKSEIEEKTNTLNDLNTKLDELKNGN